MNNFNKPSREELEAFWKGDDETRLRLYSERNRRRAEAAEKQGKKVTYYPPNSKLDEVTITATRPGRPGSKGLSTDDMIDYGITAAGFIPGLDTAADIADVGNQLRLGNYGQAAFGVGMALIPGLSASMVRRGINWVKGRIKPYIMSRTMNNSLGKGVNLFTAPKNHTRTRIGDVEIDTPAMAYRQGSKEIADDFLSTGVVNTDGAYSNPMFSQGKLWYGVPKTTTPSAPKVIETKFGKFNFSKRNEDVPKTHLLVSNAPMIGANQKAHPNSLRVGKSGNDVITDRQMISWQKEGMLDEAEKYNNMYYEGLLEDAPQVTRVIGDNVRRIPEFKGAATKENTTLYEYFPNYGYRKVVPNQNTFIFGTNIKHK